MPLTATSALDALRAVGESTRLRLVALLSHGELTVTDLTDICGQSQPRISRHLKLLVEAGVVDRHREGTWVYFSLVAGGPLRAFVDDVLGSIDPLDATFATDLDRLELVRSKRSDAAQQYFANIAAEWDHVRSLHAPDATVEAAITAAAHEVPFRSLLDIGTGTGRMLQLLATHPGVDRAVGLDSSHSMLAVARANLDRAEIRNVDLRQGDAYTPPFEPGSFDLVVLHQVLHFLDDPARAVSEAARLVAPGGRILIVDFAPHTLTFLQTEHAHRRLGFRADTVADWLTAAGVDVTTIDLIAPPADAQLTVALWLATQQEVTVRA
ncbi:MAG TPA: metalloregulator ArsR/SmtB family transcription factor [Ilumatobacter sp.]|nr:metalloregulator ArsR/SmtB family transcription factor [Ilumatobacter sp.]